MTRSAAKQALARWHRDTCYPEAMPHELDIGVAALLDALSPKEAELVKPPREYEVSGDAVGDIPAGMVAWHGGDSAPEDWDGGHVARLAGVDTICVGPVGDHWSTPWKHTGNFDIIAYTPKAPAASHDAARERIAVSDDPVTQNQVAGVLLLREARKYERAQNVFDDARSRLGLQNKMMDSDTYAVALDAILATLSTTDGAACPSCNGLNTSCPDGCGRDPLTGELDGSRLTTPPTTDASERLREALDDVLGWAIGNHDEGCTLDPEYGDPEATECTCGLDDKIAKARAALAPSNGEVSGDK